MQTFQRARRALSSSLLDNLTSSFSTSMSCHALPSFISDNRDTHTSILSLLFIQTKSFLGFNADRSFISLFEQLPRTSRFLRSGAVGLRMYTSKEVRNCEQELAEVNEDILEAKVIRVKAMSAGNLSFAEKVQVEINRLLEKELFLMQKQSWDADLLKNLASEVQLLRGLGTWTSQSEKVVGRNLLSESVLVPRLLQDISLPPLPPQPLFDIISKHFGALIEAAGEAKLQEAKVQKIYSSLFKELIAEVSKASSKVYPCFQVHDTSTSGHLKNPIAKIDFTFTCGAEAAWSDVVWLAKVKTSLNSKEEYEEAMGQVSDRAQMLFKMQPERKVVIAAVLGSSSMEILRLTRYPEQDRIKRTGLMSLTGVSSPQDLTNSPAARSLMQLLFAAEKDFGFKLPLLPQPFSLKSGANTYMLDDFVCLRAGPNPSSSAYKAKVKITSDSRESPQLPAKPVAVKFGKGEAIGNEVSVLKLLSEREMSFTPRLICYGETPDLGSCLVMEPVGCLIGLTEVTPAVIGQVALDIATTIINLSEIGILHCDVSAGNVLVTDNGRGLLVDYGSSLQGAHVGSHRVTGTLLFSALSVLWGEANTVSSDLESLFYTLLHIVCDGEVPGCREVSSARVAAYRLAAMLHPMEFEKHVLEKAPPDFHPLLSGLRNLFFKDLSAPASGHSYVNNVDPQSFLEVCRDFLK